MGKLRNLDEVVFGIADYVTSPPRSKRRGDLAQAHIEMSELLRRFFELCRDARPAPSSSVAHDLAALRGKVSAVYRQLAQVHSGLPAELTSTRAFVGQLLGDLRDALTETA